MNRAEGVNSWQPTGVVSVLEAGRLAKIVGFSSSDPHVKAELDHALAGYGGPDGLPSVQDTSKVVLVVSLEGGEFVQLRPVQHAVAVIREFGCISVNVTYLPIRLGWCTTVTASQGLEFDKVVLDLGSGSWLAGGGYSGLGRVRGDLSTGLRIPGGLHLGAAAFKAHPEAVAWYRDVVVANTS